MTIKEKLKRIICILFGHRWIYVENMIADEADYRCERCGNWKTINYRKLRKRKGV